MRQGLLLNEAGDEIIGHIMVMNDADLERQAIPNFLPVPADHVVSPGPDGGWTVEPAPLKER